MIDLFDEPYPKKSYDFCDKCGEQHKEVKREFEWCCTCPYEINCYDLHGGPYCLEPSCGEQQGKIWEHPSYEQ